MQNRVEEDLLYEVRDGIGLVSFNRPAAHNALTFEMYDRLGDICGEVRLGGAVKAIIITGAGGRAFAAGTDISLFQDFSTAQQGVAYEARMERMFAKLEKCPVPTIAAIAGEVFMGGRH